MPRSTLTTTILIAAMIVGAAFVRLIPHAPNATPVTAVALLGGAQLAMPWSFIVPLAAMFAADTVIGFDALPITLSIYGSFVLTVLLGRWLLRGNHNPWLLLTSSLVSSCLFYLITNAAVWKFSGMYPPTLDGLLLSYLYAIPFFRNTLLGDMAYVFSLFLAAQYVPVAARKFILFLRERRLFVSGVPGR